jgi:hypothetical protein
MKTRYLVIDQYNNFIGIDLKEYKNIELECLWGFWTKKELQKTFKGCTIISHSKYIEGVK